MSKKKKDGKITCYVEKKIGKNLESRKQMNLCITIAQYKNKLCNVVVSFWSDMILIEGNEWLQRVGVGFFQ